MTDERYSYVEDVKMWGVSEAKVKNHRQLLGIKDPQSSLGVLWDIDSGAKWTGFLSGIDFLSEPMSYEEFKKLSTNEKKQYLHFLVDDLEASPAEISGLFGIVTQNIRALLKKNGIPPKGREYRYNHKKWEEWLKKYKNNDSVMEEENKVTEHIQESIECKEEPKIEEKSKEIIIHNEIPSMQVHIHIDNQDQIIEMLSKLRKLEKAKSFLSGVRRIKWIFLRFLKRIGTIPGLRILQSLLFSRLVKITKRPIWVNLSIISPRNGR